MSDRPGPRAFSLAEAADELGVHYQTAYKWVRDGTLPAVRIGRAYRIEPADVDALTERRAEPSGPPRRRPRRAVTAERLLALLLDGDESSARTLARDLVAQGTPVTDVAAELIAPALRRIGDGWERGTVSVSVEHRATAIAERILADISPRPRGRRRGTAVVASVSGDHHGVVSLMAAMALREQNWRVEHLGADVPPDEIERFGADVDADLYVLSIGNEATREAATALADRLRSLGRRALVNEPGATLRDLQEAAATNSR